MNIERLRQLEEEKLITVRSHPNYPDLVVANYSTLCQINRSWTKETLACRGLIVCGDRVLARPFKKFFNWGELQGLRNHVHNLYGVKYSHIFTMPFTAYEKMDGSLGIYFRNSNGKWIFATRGSFESEQAEEASKIWKDKYDSVRLDKDYTYLFEIIYPSNRIVVEYDFTDLVLLAVIHTASGKELPYTEVENLCLPFRRPVVYRDLVSLEQAESLVNDKKNFEGFVLDFGEGFRCKIKADEYCRLHKILTGFTPRRVFEAVRNGELEAWIDNVPDEFYREVTRVKDEINEKYLTIEKIAQVDFSSLAFCSSRKDFAQRAKDKKYPALLFNLLDNNVEGFKETIWKILDKEY